MGYSKIQSTSPVDRRIVFLYRGGRQERLVAALAGTCPTEFFYGAVELIQQGYEVSVADINYELSSSGVGFVAKAFDLLFRHQLLPSRVYGPLLHKIWQELPRLQSADVIVATTPGIAFAVALLKTVYRFPARIIAIQLGLADYRFSRRRAFLNGLFLKKMRNIVYTETERLLMLEKYALPSGNTIVNQFGVDISFWQTAAYEHNGYVLAIGSDGKRDYELLVRAATEIQAQFVIVTNKEIGCQVPDNVKILKSDWLSNSLTDKDICDLYAGASIVVIPLQQTTQPSGQSVCLQAMSCGRPVVLSAISGLWSEEILRNEETVVLTDPGNISDLTRRIDELLGDESRCVRIGTAARLAVSRYATTDRWASQLKSLIEE